MVNIMKLRRALTVNMVSRQMAVHRIGEERVLNLLKSEETQLCWLALGLLALFVGGSVGLYGLWRREIDPWGVVLLTLSVTALLFVGLRLRAARQDNAEIEERFAEFSTLRYELGYQPGQIMVHDDAFERISRTLLRLAKAVIVAERTEVRSLRRGENFGLKAPIGAKARFESAYGLFSGFAVLPGKSFYMDRARAEMGPE